MLTLPKFTSEERLPIKSFKNEFAFTKVKIIPNWINWLIIVFSCEVIAKYTTKIREIRIWRKSIERKFLSQDLKNQLDLLLISEIIAKGEIKIKTLIITYLIEYEIVRVIKLIEIRLFRSPSKLKRLNNPSKK